MVKRQPVDEASEKNLFKGPTDPNVVKAVNQSDLAPIPTIDRDGCLVLLGPKPSSKKDATPIFEVVAHSEKNHSQSFR